MNQTTHTPGGPMRHSPMAALFALFALALLVACDGKAPPASPPSSPATSAATPTTPATTPCARLTDAQAALVLGLPAAKALPDKADSCTWSSGKDDTPFPILNLSVNRYADEASAVKLFEATSNMQSKLSKGINAAVGEKTRRSGRAPEGLGDEAWLQADEMAGVDTALLVVRHGGTVFTLGVTGMGSAQGLGARLEAAGRTVVAQP